MSESAGKTENAVLGSAVGGLIRDTAQGEDRGNVYNPTSAIGQMGRSLFANVIRS